jgi:hypothetical protein
MTVSLRHGAILARRCYMVRGGRPGRVSDRPNVRVDIERIAAQIFASRQRYLQLVGTAQIVIARADATLRAAPALHSSVPSIEYRKSPSRPFPRAPSAVRIQSTLDPAELKPEANRYSHREQPDTDQ